MKKNHLTVHHFRDWKQPKICCWYKSIISQISATEEDGMTQPKNRVREKRGEST